MNEVVKTEGGSSADTAKLVLAIVIVLGGLVAFYWLQGSQSDLTRWGIFVGSLVLGAVVLYSSQYGRDLNKFVQEARVELYKVFWPTRSETLNTTMVVFGFVVILSLFFWLLDTILTWATKLLSGQGG